MLKQTILITILFITSVHAQVVNTGGGGPDGQRVAKKDEPLNQKLKEQMIDAVARENDKVMDEIRESWSECYTTKLKAKNLIDLYAQLTIHAAGHGPNVRKKHQKEYGGENCEKSKVFACFLKQQSLRNHIYSLITTSSFHYYLVSKGIDKLESREQLIKYYLELMEGI